MIIIKAVDKIQSYRRYVSGSVSSNGVYTCLAFQGYNEDGGRDYVDVQRTYRNNTEAAVAAKLLTVHNNNSNSYYWNTDDGTLKDRVQCDTSSVSNSEFKESLVIAPKQYVTVKSNTFEISAVNDNKMTLWSQIYLKNLADKE